MLDKQFERGQEVENEMIELTEQSAQPREKETLRDYRKIGPVSRYTCSCIKIALR